MVKHARYRYKYDTPFSVRLRRAINRKQCNKSELAQKVMCSAQTLYWYYSGRSQPPHDVLVRLCRELGVSADWLLGLVDDEEE